MTREIRGVAALWLAVTLVAFGLFSPATAQAATAPVANPANPCGIEGWFDNPDEANRTPTATFDGFIFEDADLIHHNAPAGLTTATLSPGHYLASPAPDQPSFFSVEVSGDDGGYATLRYNRVTHLWNLVTGGVFYENADPSALADMPPVHRSHKVVRFGVGYTANPPGTVKTTVKSVSFQGNAYYFSCPKPSPTPSQTTTSPTTGPSPTPSKTTSSPGSSPSTTGSATASGTPAPSASASTSQPTTVVPADDSDALPTTGASLGGVIAGALAVLFLGVGMIFLARRRKGKRVGTTNDTPREEQPW